MSEPALIVDDLVVRYPGRAAAAVSGASLRAVAGEVTALLGPNGAGKTSTIECCVGLRSPTGGSIRTLGVDGRARGRAAHRARIGVMLQDGGLPGGVKPLTLLRHLAGFYAHPVDVSELAERLGIDEFARTSVRRLSGGQRQRVALAAAVIGRPELVFMDEPTAGLDPASKLVVRDLLAEHCGAGAAVLLTTHDLDEAARVAHRVVVMHEGRVVADASPEHLTAGLPRTLVLRLPPGADDAAAAALCGDRPAAPTTPALPQLTRQARGEYRACGVDLGPAELAAVAQWCSENGYAAADLELRPPSLEDVVLSLTAEER